MNSLHQLSLYFTGLNLRYIRGHGLECQPDFDCSSHFPHCSEHPASSRSSVRKEPADFGGLFFWFLLRIHLDEPGASARSSRDVASRPAGRTTPNTHGWGKLINNMSNLPNYYFQDLPAYVMEEIITGMIDGKTAPTPEEMEELRTSELEREAEALLV
jgi:hypothetical protein